jgi:hypothetical protein
VRCMQVRLEPALTQHKHGVLPVLLLCLEDVTDVMDGCPGRILAGSAASSSSAQSLFRTSQIQEEAIVTGLSALELMSDEAQKEQLEQQRHAACEPSFMYGREKGREEEDMLRYNVLSCNEEVQH